jgi:Cu/Ag efflux protein CusF
MNRNLAVLPVLGALAILVALPVAALAQKPITQTEKVTAKATIDAIDHDNRLITLKDKDGSYETIYAGPEVRRFDELKVGDKITVRSTESVVYQVRKPGEPVPPSATDDPAIVRGTGAKPSGTITQQQTATVTVKAIDPKTAALTVQDESGHTSSYKIADKGKIKGINPGDRIVITYTVALAITIE